MSSTPETPTPPTTPAETGEKKNSSGLVTIAMIVMLILFLGRDPSRLWNIAKVLLGLGSVIFVHELGHFLAAKATGIFVEAFSIGMGPIVLGLKRLAGKLQVRVFPELIPGKDGLGALSFNLPVGFKKDGESEYQLRLIPLGGFVKMLGQEDFGADEMTEDPRSFANKPIWQRAVVISAGVVMNVIAAIVVFMAVYAQGVFMPPPVVGDVIDGMPAAQAGLQPGDEIIAVNDKENFLTFSDLAIAGALSDPCQEIRLKVKRPDDSIADITVIAEQRPGDEIRRLGIQPPVSNTIAEIEGDQAVAALEEMGLMPGDTIVALNGKDIEHGWQLGPWQQILYDPAAITGPITMAIERQTNGNAQRVETKIDYEFGLAANTEDGIMGLIPLLEITHVAPDKPAAAAGLQQGDVILQVGTIGNPTYQELTEYVNNHVNKAIDIIVYRNQSEQVKTSVTPSVLKDGQWKRMMSNQGQRAIIGVHLRPALAAPAIAQCESWSDEPDTQALDLPRGAVIRAVNGAEITSWRDLHEQLYPLRGQTVQLTYQPGWEQPAQEIDVAVPDDDKAFAIGYVPDLGGLPQLPLLPEKRLYQAESLPQTIQMGWASTYSFITQTYLTLKQIISGSVSGSSVMGPVGILKVSYTMASQQTANEFLHWIAMISVCIAVFNFLPLPILDGGLIVMLIIEKIKGSPVPAGIMNAVTYVGLALLGMFVLFVTYHDVMRLVKGAI